MAVLCSDSCAALVMELMQLEMFVAVVEEGSVRHAAEHLLRTQPAVSMATSKLEREFETLLLTDRSVLSSSLRRAENRFPVTQTDSRPVQQGRSGIGANRRARRRLANGRDPSTQTYGQRTLVRAK